MSATLERSHMDAIDLRQLRARYEQVLQIVLERIDDIDQQLDLLQDDTEFAVTDVEP
jgi:hypothetical protein